MRGCWLWVLPAGWHGDAQSHAAKGLVAALLFYDVAVAIVLAYAAIGSGLFGVALWPAVILHTVMSIWCVVCLRRSLKLSFLEIKS